MFSFDTCLGRVILSELSDFSFIVHVFKSYVRLQSILDQTIKRSKVLINALLRTLHLALAFEPRHDKTNNVSVRPAKTNSDQPGHPPSLISVFAVRMKKSWALSYPLSAQQRLWSDWADAERTAKTLIRLGGCPGWSESSLGAHSFC